MSSVVVTGATGFVGGHIARGLDETNVIGLGRDRDALTLLEQAGVQAEKIDLTSQETAERIAGFDPKLIIHAAARSSPWGTHAEFDAANVNTTEAVIEAASNARASLIYISTPSVYINGQHRRDIGEDGPLPTSFVNHYTATKFAGERSVLDFAKTGLPAVILRPQAIVGAGDTTLAPRFLRILERGVLPLFDGGNAVLDMTSVENVVEATRLAGDALIDGRIDGAETFNVTNGDPRPIRDLLKMIVDVRSKLVPGAGTPRELMVPASPARLVARGLEGLSRISGRWEPPITQYTVDSLVFDRTLNIGKLREQLGFDPSQHRLEDSIESYFLHDQAVQCRS